MFPHSTHARLRSALAALVTVAGLMTGLTAAPARADIPGELYEALGLDKNVAPNVLYDALVARYRDPAQGAGKGQFAELWEPIPFSVYMNPTTFYQGREDLDFDVERGDCVACHESTTPGWVHSWKSSVHGNLDEIRALPETDSRHYKIGMIDEVETNLRSMGLLGADTPLAEVGCIDFHMGVGATSGNHMTDLALPDAASCGQCHVQQFAERESERDTLTWPQDQWPAGRPSHALSYLANVETAIWVGMAERETEVHMKKEELILFPAIRKGGMPGIEQPIAVMRADHDEHDREIAEIRRLTANLTLPQGACRTWSALYAGLAEFVADLEEHIRLENEVLFPRFEEAVRHG